MTEERKRVPPPMPAKQPMPFCIRVVKNGAERVLELDGKHAEAISKVWPVAYLGMIAEVRIADVPI